MSEVSNAQEVAGGGRVCEARPNKDIGQLRASEAGNGFLGL
jgi:hypothetical protein